MVEYVAISIVKEKMGETEDELYGICAYENKNGLICVENCVYNVSDDLRWIKALVDKLNLNNVDPVHLLDIVEDEVSMYKPSDGSNDEKGVC